MSDSSAEARDRYEAWHTRFGVDAALDTPWHRMLQSRFTVHSLRHQRILEIGCGRGGFAAWLRQQVGAAGYVVAEDFAHAAVRMAHDHGRTAGGGRGSYAVASLLALPHPDGSFDTVVSAETVEHLPDPARGVAEMARVLKPGGSLFLTTPNYLGPMGLYRVYRRLTGRPYTEEGQPINVFTLLPRTRHWLRRARLRVRYMATSGHYLPIPGRPPVAVTPPPALAFLGRWFGLHSLFVADKV